MIGVLLSIINGILCMICYIGIFIGFTALLVTPPKIPLLLRPFMPSSPASPVPHMLLFPCFLIVRDFWTAMTVLILSIHYQEGIRKGKKIPEILYLPEVQKIFNASMTLIAVSLNIIA